MEIDEPSSSSLTSTSIQDTQIAEIALEEGINVWGTNQQTLEIQALQEIDLFTKETGNLEDGEIVDSIKTVFAPSLDLDINSYIQKQQDLKKSQQRWRTEHIDTKSKLIADKVIKRQTKRKPCKKVKAEKKIKLSSCETEKDNGSGSEYVPSESEMDSDNGREYIQSKRKTYSHDSQITDKFKDDGCIKSYKNRLEHYYKHLEETDKSNLIDEPEDLEYYTIKGGLKVPFKMWNNLYSYQQDGVRWLWNIHESSTGGILGDEMGLGKTVQVIVFLASLRYSQFIKDGFKGLGPTVIVCPATVIHQWVEHFHEWSPELRVAVLHQSGSFQGNKSKLIKEINTDKGILVTSYVGILKYKQNLLDYNWHYLILDEGHKIRNHNAKVSKAVKQIRTPHRLMLTGSPMQNNLLELWSLFDFTNPGMLGDITVFTEHFSNPIIQGGFANASSMQEATALSVATTLKNVITPFLLRRSKQEVQEHISLPDKSEQVLFCSLTEEQRDLYKGFLMSDQVEFILSGGSKTSFSESKTRGNVLVAITALRKICNHPDIYLTEADDGNDEDFGNYKKSGKMVVVSALLKIWKKQKHRVLLFTQSRAMLRVFEAFLTKQEYKYLKMDGTTSVGSRQPMINKFNEDSSYDVFLLTTRVGGLGVNLTGANRVIIYDPDWNPATDTQARERAWRIGQDKQVTIYRLLSAGTIEEKMYQRQIWKQLLSNKVLLDPKTHRFFQASNLHDLFSLPESSGDSETANIFRDSRVKIQKRLNEKSKKKSKKADVPFSEDKIQAMRSLAQQISKSMTKQPTSEKSKSLYQLEIEGERRKKLEERAEMKKLTAMEIIQLNRERAKEKPEIPGNQVDDLDVIDSFSRALEYSETASKLYNELKANDKVRNIRGDSTEKNHHHHHHEKSKHKGKHKSVVDDSGRIDGEKVEGLLKTEARKVHKKDSVADANESQDSYVLEKLFSRKGVSGALQHDSIMGNSVKTNSLRVQCEADTKADKALEALKKSRLSGWRS